MKLTIETDFNIGDTVYLRTDVEQNARIITGITIRPTGLSYSVSFSSMESAHYAIELSKEKDVLMGLVAYNQHEQS